VHAILADGVVGKGLAVPVLRDATGEFRAAYAAVDGTLVAVRPDGYVGHRGSVSDIPGVAGYATKVVAAAGEPSFAAG
jgi:hypothetical protein